MRDKIKRVVCILFVLLVLATNLPLSARAVDPVSAATIANAFAQAITAYGASNGVSLTFDGVTSGNTSNIGETVHELWKAFRSGQQTADDYETLAAAIFPGLYSKAITAGGTAVVAVNIAEQYMPDIDDFWNWLLSGPAEMVKVDNAFQWNVNPVTNAIDPITVSFVKNFSNQPLPYVANPQADIATINQSIPYAYKSKNANWIEYIGTTNSNASIYSFFVFDSVNNRYNSYILSNVSLYNAVYKIVYYAADDISKFNLNMGREGEYPNLYLYTAGYNTQGVFNPVFDSLEDAISFLTDYEENPSINTNATVQPYVGDAVARPVPIPDTSDPDYGPLPYIGNLPIPWNDTLFGDGTGILTDAQSDAITDAIDDSIVANPDKTIEMEDSTTDDPDKPTTDDPPSNDPDDYAVPGLQNIFPFCIPFDVYNFLSALAAEPTAPHFTATLQFPAAIGGPQTIDIDFNNQTFNTLAGILRTLELLAFIVGLALLTRSMFIRG